MCLSSAVAIGMVTEVDLGLRLTVGVANLRGDSIFEVDRGDAEPDFTTSLLWTMLDVQS